MSMFCYQCQETAMGTGCTLKGVCGKTSEVANLQDLLLFVVRGIAVYNEHLRKDGHPSEQADKFIYDALFITITNANFDKVAITEKIKEGLKLKKELGNKIKIEMLLTNVFGMETKMSLKRNQKRSVCFALPTRISAH